MPTASPRASRVRGFWTDDRGLHALLVAQVLLLFVAPPLTAAGLLPPLVSDICFAAILAAGLVVVRQWRRGRALLLVAAVALGAVALRVAATATTSTIVGVVDVALSLAATGAFLALILMRVYGAGPVTTGRIEGAVAAYLMTGVVWAIAYRAVALHDPFAFQAGGRAVTGEPDLSYFSFVTLATLGYGDITPVSAAARALATLEGLVGQLYPAILIARLVSLEIADRERAR